MIGRTTAVLVMLAGVGIIGALASILASLLVPDEDSPDQEAGVEAAAAAATDMARELALLRAEIAELRTAVAARPPG
jgi:hypothetical protein